MIQTENNIDAYVHCQKCLKEYLGNDELNSTMSPKDYARTQAGFTKIDLQIWCNRHECNVMHIDFEGRQHPAIVRAQPESMKWETP